MQTNKQSDRLTGRHGLYSINPYTNRHMYRQTNRQAQTEVDRQEYGETYRQVTVIVLSKNILKHIYMASPLNIEQARQTDRPLAVIVKL